MWTRFEVVQCGLGVKDVGLCNTSKDWVRAGVFFFPQLLSSLHRRLGQRSRAWFIILHGMALLGVCICLEARRSLWVWFLSAGLSEVWIFQPK